VSSDFEHKAEEATARIDTLIAFYRQQVRDTDSDAETILADLLADLMHWAGVQRTEDGDEVSFDTCVNKAEFHFDAEQRGEF
jgi:hypothetical protein